MAEQEEMLLDELATELFELEDGVLLGAELELTTELFELEAELGALLATELFELDDVVVAEHTAPVMVGFSAATPLVSP